MSMHFMYCCLVVIINKHDAAAADDDDDVNDLDCLPHGPVDKAIKKSLKQLEP